MKRNNNELRYHTVKNKNATITYPEKNSIVLNKLPVSPIFFARKVSAAPCGTPKIKIIITGKYESIIT